MKKFCDICGQEQQENETYCLMCGKRVAGISPPPQPTYYNQSHQQYAKTMQHQNTYQKQSTGQHYTYNQLKSTSLQKPKGIIPGRIMIICSIASTTLGAILVFFGIYLNNNKEALYRIYMSYNPTRLPGAGYTTVGMMCFILGVALFVAFYIRKLKLKEPNIDKLFCHKCGVKL